MKMRLQVDSTVVYALFGGDGPPPGFVLSRDDLTTDSPFNTYTVDGLPPAPIGNPSRLALQAVANPLSSRDLFYVADGQGAYAFAETYEEHLLNVESWIELNRRTAIPAATENSLRATLYEESFHSAGPDTGAAISIPAAVDWHLKDGLSGPEIEARVHVPKRAMTIRLAIRRNNDPSLPASHIVETVIDTRAGFDGKGIRNVPRLLFKESENEDGVALIGASGRRAILTFEKGTTGGRVFSQALDAWGIGSDPAPLVFKPPAGSASPVTTMAP